jgi:hypothetical protein
MISKLLGQNLIHLALEDLQPVDNWFARHPIASLKQNKDPFLQPEQMKRLMRRL